MDSCEQPQLPPTSIAEFFGFIPAFVFIHFYALSFLVWGPQYMAQSWMLQSPHGDLQRRWGWAGQSSALPHRLLEQEEGASKKDGVRQEGLVLLSSKIACLPLRLNWVETVVQIISLRTWWLHTTIAGLLEEARDGTRTLRQEEGEKS